MVTVRGYGRASTSAQVLSTDQQHSKVKDAFAAYKTIKPEWAEAIWGGFLSDEATSRVSCFRERNSGSLLLAACQQGDVILVSNYDRIFANVVDVCETLQLLKDMKVGLIILDAQIDTTTIIGDFCFKLLALVKELDVNTIRQRMRDSIAYRKRAGLPYTGNIPIGWEHREFTVPGVPRVQRRLVECHSDRRLAREILRIRESMPKVGVEQVSQYCNSIGLKQKSGRRWTLLTFKAWCRAAVNNFPLHNGLHTPAPIPPDAVPVIRKTLTADD